MGQFVAYGMRDVIVGHLPVVVRLYGEGGVDAAELLHGQQSGVDKGLWIGIISIQLGIGLAQPNHGSPAVLSQSGKFPGRGCGVCFHLSGIQTVQKIAGVVYFQQGAVDLVGKITAQRQQLLGGGAFCGNTCLIGKGSPVIVEAAVYREQK